MWNYECYDCCSQLSEMWSLSKRSLFWQLRTTIIILIVTLQLRVTRGSDMFIVWLIVDLQEVPQVLQVHLQTVEQLHGKVATAAPAAPEFFLSRIFSRQTAQTHIYNFPIIIWTSFPWTPLSRDSFLIVKPGVGFLGRGQGCELSEGCQGFAEEPPCLQH